MSADAEVERAVAAPRDVALGDVALGHVALGDVALGDVAVGGPAPRAGAAGDVASLLVLDAACFAAPWSASVWRHELRARERIWLVVPGRSGELVAVGGLWLASDAAHVLKLAVAPGRRQRGIGGRLLAALDGAAAQAGHDALTLEVRASNREARSLYGRHGFVAVGVRPRYYPDGEDAVILWRHGADGRSPTERR